MSEARLRSGGSPSPSGASSMRDRLGRDGRSRGISPAAAPVRIGGALHERRPCRRLGLSRLDGARRRRAGGDAADGARAQHLRRGLLGDPLLARRPHRPKARAVAAARRRPPRLPRRRDQAAGRDLPAARRRNGLAHRPPFRPHRHRRWHLPVADPDLRRLGGDADGVRHRHHLHPLQLGVRPSRQLRLGPATALRPPDLSRRGDGGRARRHGARGQAPAERDDPQGARRRARDRGAEADLHVRACAKLWEADIRPMNHDGYADSYIREILKLVKTVALVGASHKPERPSWIVLKYLKERGYEVFPVNPGLAGQEILGRKVYARLGDLPVPVDMVEIFRNSKVAGPITDEALALSPPPKVIWMQLSVRNDEAAAKAEAAGLKVVMNRCPKIEYGRLSGEIGWQGINDRNLSAKKPALAGKGFQKLTIFRPGT